MKERAAEFAGKLRAYKAIIDADIAAYSQHVRKVTLDQYGQYPSVVTDEYLDLLTRGGKRIRGALVICGYEMLGGQDKTMIARAATAIEMLHASMLIIDDIQDHDVVRRDKPAVHVALAEYHKKLGMRGDPKATGISLALNASLTGSHAAQVLLAGLNVDPELTIKVIGIVNNTIVLTLHGQTYDVINAGLKNPKLADVARATEWKSAHYTFLNPLCVGMVLAGAGCEDTDAIRDYALNTGIAFQLADDLMDGDIKATDVPKTRRL
ncbi:MAG TPA: polyprenyl synthetase family protein, partial [Candidatus Saccharimonadales bacterium]|nr:polyprenyl synthetase family protein [Candidatus Saccharimonadales bacterium]